MLLNAFLTGQTCFDLMLSPVLTLSPPPRHYPPAQRSPPLLAKRATDASLVIVAPTVKEATVSFLGCWNLLLGHQKTHSLFRSSCFTTTTTTTYQLRVPSSLWRAVRRPLWTVPTTCATSDLPLLSVALRQTTCNAAFPAPALTSFPLPWMQTHDSGLHPQAPILSQQLVLVPCAPAVRHIPSLVAYNVRRPYLHPATQSYPTTLCSALKKGLSLL